MLILPKNSCPLDWAPASMGYMKLFRKKSRKFFQNLKLFCRWQCSRKRKGLARSSDALLGNGLEKCDIFYINLGDRADRRFQIEAEYCRLGVKNFLRIEGIRDDNGALGCASSHLKVLMEWRPKFDRLLMICEDDCSFLLDRDRIDMIIDAFYADERLDVLCLAYKALNGFSISPDLAVTSDTQTTSCYVIRERVRNDLCRIAAKSVELLRQGVREDRAAIDRVWKDLQRSVFFAIPNERAASQITSFSDIKGKVVNYGV